MDVGVPDGIKVDVEGNIWTAVGDGVAAFSRGDFPAISGSVAWVLVPTCDNSLYHIPATTPENSTPSRLNTGVSGGFATMHRTTLLVLLQKQ